MKAGDTRDIVAGTLIALTGLFISFYAGLNYELGSLRQMGPGTFPFGLGILLAILGLLTVVGALRRRPSPIEIRPRTAAAVIVGVASFAVVVGPMGLLPAIVSVVVISSLAETTIRPGSILVLCIVLSAIAFLIFRVALGLPIKLLDWPF